MTLRAFPLNLAEANAEIARLHRHHKPVRFHLFSVGVADGDRGLVGVAVVMRPANQHMSFEGFMVEVSRLATDGTKNACSFLLSACARIAFELGYWCIQTYTMPTEGGASLRAAGREEMGRTRGNGWNTVKRKRADAHPLGPKIRWWRMRPDLRRKIGGAE